MKKRRLFLTASILSFVFSVAQLANEYNISDSEEEKLTFQIEKKGKGRELIPLSGTNDTLVIDSYSKNPVIYYHQDTFSLFQDSEYRYLLKNHSDTVLSIDADDLMTYHFKNKTYQLEKLDKNSWKLSSEGDYYTNISYDKKEDQLMLEGEITKDFYLELGVIVYAVNNLNDSSSLVIVGLVLAALAGILRATSPPRYLP